MTWVIGMAHPFGYATVFSDIRVTFRNHSTGHHSTMDCLQKVYMVGRYLTMGFAGSVAIGFGMIETLARLLHHQDENMVWIPSEVAKWWQFDAQEVFNNYPKLERKLGCKLVLAGVH